MNKNKNLMENIFLSIGRPYNEKYEKFAEALIKYGRDRGFNLQSVGYNVGTHNRPLVKITEVLNESKGAIVVAFSRIHIQEGNEKGVKLSDTHITTPWNQIEAAMAYVQHIPLLVIAEKGLKKEGLIEIGNDWYVHEMEMIPKSLEEKSFELSFEEWSHAVRNNNRLSSIEESYEKMTIRDFFSKMTMSKIIGFILAFIGLLIAAFSAGIMFRGK